jgi:16S rRNA (guanine527-N7)-methyltransferase
MTPADVRLLEDAARKLGIDVGTAAVERLARFLDLLAVWNRRVHLTGERSLSSLVRNHTIDSLAPAPHIPRTGLVVDIGSGAGFPGIVIGCLRPDVEIVLIESRRRRASFLREAIRAIPLRAARALEMRAEEAATDPELAGRAAVAIARALRLDVFLALAAPLLAPYGTAIAMQTPRTAGLARGRALEHGFRLAARRDYGLPGGAARTLLFFDRGSPVS